jgi:hypothetical protein
MTLQSIGSLFNQNHATAVNSCKVVSEMLQVKNWDYIDCMANWVDIFENVMPTSIEEVFSVEERLYSIIESSLLNNQSKIDLLNKMMKNYESDPLV